MAKRDPRVLDHLEWLGFLQPTGLVVSPTALVRAGAILDRRDAEGQRLLRDAVEERVFDGRTDPAPWIPDFETFASSVLGWSWSPKGYAGSADNPIPDDLRVTLVEFDETLAPDYAVREIDPQDDDSGWQLLIRALAPGRDLDAVSRGKGGLEASAHGRMERLLRRSGVPAGLLFNGRVLRLISAPRGESSGWMNFQVAEMLPTAGRPICAALRLLLGQTRLLSLPRAERLAALLEDSRKYQNEVSDRLAQQVLHALYELLRGFQAAHDQAKGELLCAPLTHHPDEVYRSLLTVLLRLVFLLYAEERSMLPGDETFLRHYSLAGLYERLREDAALFPDTMDQRCGAWAQLLVLFRLVFDGADSGTLHLPRRHGSLFDPDRFPFLEGRFAGGGRQIHERIEPPLVPDGTIYRALDKLLVLDGERISYRALDVEQIGSVYETMMGFRLETATGRSAAIKAAKRHGAPATVDLDALLGVDPKKRRKWVRDHTDRKLSAKVGNAVSDAATLEDLHAALEPVLDKNATPDLVPRGSMVLQPSEERRRSGSHYTPRSLTEPIVRTTLEPILERLNEDSGAPPLPEAILDLKICDPAMGSAAFLVEACRQLGDVLVDSWHAHDALPPIPPDEDEVIFARRLIAQRCLYGVDKNPVAVDLAKVSLWLATLAKDHPFTFVDHALRHGDSLVGLSLRQVESFHWNADAPKFQTGIEIAHVREHLAKVRAVRNRIREAGEHVPDWELRGLWSEAQDELEQVRLLGDLVLAAFFTESTAKNREIKRNALADEVASRAAAKHAAWCDELRHADPALVPLHWELEFPEVYDRDSPGFDAIVGNPPFAGKNTIASANPREYPAWLKHVHAESHGNADLVAHFFRRAFDQLRRDGTFGLIATNTIAQGDTRATGLRWICTHGGEIYAARRRVKWPGLAAVVVSVVHVVRGDFARNRLLDGRVVETITAFLFHRGGHGDPARLAANAAKSFVGSYVLGMGFTFDDTDTKGIATPIAEMNRLIEKNPRNQEVIFPYIGGQEVNSSPTHAHHRYVINFGNRSEGKCRRRWPDLMEIVEEKVKPDRLMNNRDGYRRHWWQYAEKRVELYEVIAGVEAVWATCRVQPQWSVAGLASASVFAESLIVFALGGFAGFSVLQSRLHEQWARSFGSTFKDDPRYTPSDCFETFPFPEEWAKHPELERAGKKYYELRASLMVENHEGLTRTYNRFHDPHEKSPAILRLRELHAEMDRAILGAYGWGEIPTDCEFLLDYEINEDEWSPRRKKPWRYRWPDDVHDEVLARLLELNAKRAQEEALAGRPTKERAKPPRDSSEEERTLFS